MSQDPARLQRALQLFDDALDQPADTRDAWLAHACAGDAELLAQVQALLALPPGDLEALGRVLAQQLVLLAQGCLLRQQAPAFVADAFIATRLGEAGSGARVVGAIDTRGLDVDAILQRALPA